MSPEHTARTVNAAWSAHVALQKRPPRIIWLAEDEGGVAHAHFPGMVRTFCKRKVIDEVWAWPRKTRCTACIEALEQAVQ